MDGSGGEGGGEEGRRRPRGEVDDEDDNDDNGDNSGPSPRMHCCHPLADVRRDDSTIRGLLEAHHK